jgi:hypothetical protein
MKCQNCESEFTLKPNASVCPDCYTPLPSSEPMDINEAMTVLGNLPDDPLDPVGEQTRQAVLRVSQELNRLGRCSEWILKHGHGVYRALYAIEGTTDRTHALRCLIEPEKYQRTY